MPNRPTISGVLVICAWTADFFSWRLQDMDPQLTAQGAVTHALLALQGQLVAVTVLMGGFLAARTSRGLVTQPANTTFDVVSLFVLYATGQGVATAMLLRFFPVSV